MDARWAQPRAVRSCADRVPPIWTADVTTFQVTAVDSTGVGEGFVAGLLQGIVKDPPTLRDDQNRG